MGRRRKLKNKRKRHLKRTLLIIACVILVAGGIVYSAFKVTDIEYEGNEYYDDQQMSDFLFGGNSPNALLYMLFGNKSKQIPFIQKYDVEIHWPNKMVVTVYEKSMVGYISYMGCNMYFDKDGIVVESSTEVFDGVPQITGLSFDSIVVDSKLDVGNDKVFSELLEMTQAFDKYNLSIKKVYFDSSYDVTLYMGSVKVLLGSAEDCMDKLYALKQMESQLSNKSGTLYLEDYDGNSSSIIFKKEN